jgi:transcriptional regulator with GAF, ATPase, and Fis domain
MRPEADVSVRRGIKEVSMDGRDALHEQLESLHAISVEIAALRDMAEIHDRALGYCLKLTDSEFAFTGLVTDDARSMDVAAIKGFQPASPDFYDRFHEIPVRSSVFGLTITEQRPTVSNDVPHDPHSVGTPPGHPPVKTFLGVPLRVGSNLTGMIGVANKPSGYASEDERLLQTFANQVAVAIDNARLYQHQQAMIDRLQDLNHRLNEAEQEKVLRASGSGSPKDCTTRSARTSSPSDSASARSSTTRQIRRSRRSSTSSAGSRSRPQSTSAGSSSPRPRRPTCTAT